MSISFFQARFLLIFVFLTACGGGGGGNDGDPTSPPLLAFADPDAKGTVVLTAVSLESATRSTAALTGTLDRDANIASIGTLSGTINADRNQIVLNGGGLVELTLSDTDFAGFFDATPTGVDRTIGIVGVATPAADMPPGGTVSYTGTSELTILDNITRYELAGDAFVVADFSNDTVTSTINNLSGTQQIGLTAPVDVTDVATIAFTGSEIEGTTFSGGTADLQSDTISSLSGSAERSLDGAFFGPDAKEVGAVFVVDDTTEGTVTVFGRLLAQ